MRNIYKMREWKRDAISPPWWNLPWRGEGACLTKTFSPQGINKNSSERCCYVGSEQTDLLYVNAKDLIQSWRIYIRVAPLSLLSSRHLSVLVWGRLISYIKIYHLFAGYQYIISFPLQVVVAGVFVFGGEIWHFQIRR